jgi:hypothetical protein
VPPFLFPETPMTHRYSVALRNNQVSQIQSTVGTTGQLRIYSGAEPLTCAAAEPAGTLATITLPAAFLSSTGGVTTISGIWSVSASTPTPATAVCYRIYDGGGVCHVQGNVISDLVLNNTSINPGQTVTVTSYSVTAGNA